MSELRTALPKITTPLPGPKAQALIERRAKATPKAIGTAYKAVIERGEGAMFEDVDGNIFLDWIAGVGVLNIGYSHPELIEAVIRSTGRRVLQDRAGKRRGEAGILRMLRFRSG